jgi:uncharacterized protein (TIGR03382 family)
VAALGATSLAFGNVTVGQSKALTTTVRNTGNASLSVTGVTTCSNTTPPFSMSPSAAFSVAAAGSQTLTVTFAPSSSGDATGCFKLATSDPAHATLTLNVTGTGTAVATPNATLTPTALDFGSVTVGQSKPLTASVGNSGAASLSVTGVTTCDSSSSPAFTVSPSGAFTVAAGARQTVTVTFAPSSAGAASACYRIATSDPAHATLQLTATGTAADVTAPPPPPPPPSTLECGSCHSIPPSSGKHQLHADITGCGTCHGAAYSSTTVDDATHMNGTVEMTRQSGWSRSRRSCSNDCHGRERWGRGGTVRSRDGEDLYVGPEDVADGELAAGCSSAGGPLTGVALGFIALYAATRRRRVRDQA